MLQSSIWVALGGAMGSLMRFWFGEWFSSVSDSRFPWATVLVNISGSFLIGLIATLTAPDGRYVATPVARQFLMVGICGGYTTFSAFSLQTLVLAQTGDWPRAGANVVASVVLCLVAVWLGHLAAAALNGA